MQGSSIQFKKRPSSPSFSTSEIHISFIVFDMVIVVKSIQNLKFLVRECTKIYNKTCPLQTFIKSVLSIRILYRTVVCPKVDFY